jgi:hypothetical protein
VGVVIEMVRRFLRYVRYVHPVQWAAGFAVGCVVTAVPLTVVAVMHPTIAVCYATDGTDVDTTFLNGGADYYPVDVAFTVTHTSQSYLGLFIPPARSGRNGNLRGTRMEALGDGGTCRIHPETREDPAV